MTRKGNMKVVIVEDEKLVGLVTTHDLLQYSFNCPVVEQENEPFEEGRESMK